MTAESAQYLTLEAIFEKHDKLIIPDYQRAYSWEHMHIQDMIDDIEHVLSHAENQDYSHFCGTLILSRHQTDISIYNIIDGQQRLTTLLLFLSCLSSQKTLDTVMTELINNSYMGNSSNRPFISNAIDKEYFTRTILDNDEATDKEKSYSHLLLDSAKKQCLAWLSKCDDAKIARIYTIITEKLKFIVFVTTHEASEGLMFEAINNRGRYLSEMDKLKNYLLYTISKHRFEDLKSSVQDTWQYFNQKIGSLGAAFNHNDEDTILRNVVYSFVDPKTRREAGETDYKIIKVWLEKTNNDMLAQRIQSFLRYVQDCANYYVLLKKAKDSTTDDKTKYLTYLNHHASIASILPLYFSVMKMTEGENNKDLRITSLATLEKANFRVYCVPNILKRKDSERPILYGLAHEILKDEADKEQVTIDEALLKIQEFTKKHCPLKRLVEKLTINDNDDYINYCDWQDVKYFLARYENYALKRQSFNIADAFARKEENNASNDRYEKEHFLPTNPKDLHLTWWEKDEYSYNIEYCRLGNIVLCPKGTNAQLGNAGAEKKNININEAKDGITKQLQDVSRHFDKAVTNIESYHEIPKRNTFNRLKYKHMAFNDIREYALISFALEAWSFDDEQKERKEFQKIDSISPKHLNNNKVYYWGDKSTKKAS